MNNWREDFEAMKTVMQGATPGRVAYSGGGDFMSGYEVHHAELPWEKFGLLDGFKLEDAKALMTARNNLPAVMRFAELLAEVCTDYVPGFDLDLMWQQAKAAEEK